MPSYTKIEDECISKIVVAKNELIRAIAIMEKGGSMKDFNSTEDVCRILLEVRNEVNFVLKEYAK
jgi:hypothetical protein